jgi:hypothetical protein
MSRRNSVGSIYQLVLPRMSVNMDYLFLYYRVYPRIHDPAMSFGDSEQSAPKAVQFRDRASSGDFLSGRRAVARTSDSACSNWYILCVMRDDRSLLEAALGDGRFLVALTGFSVALSGLFAVLQSLSGRYRMIAMRSAWTQPRCHKRRTRGWLGLCFMIASHTADHCWRSV